MDSSKISLSSPFLISQFTHGRLDSSRAKEIQLTLYKDQRKGRKFKERDILTAESCSLTYSSEHTMELMESQNLMKYVVGVYDPENDEMSIHHASKFLLKPVLLTNFGQGNQSKGMTYMQKKDQLTEAFGSKKGKRVIHIRKENKVDSDALETKVNNLAETIKVEQIAPVTESRTFGGMYDLHPPFDKEAQTPADVYDIDSIIPPEEMDALQAPAQELFDSSRTDVDKWETEQRFGKQAIKLLRCLPIKEDDRFNKCCCILQLHFMIAIYHFNSLVWKQKNPFQSLEEYTTVPTQTKKGLLNRFTVSADGSKIHMVSRKLKDKLALYILVLSLYLEEYNLNICDLQSDLRMVPERIKNLFQSLGCKISASKRNVEGSLREASTTATLVTPLVFPEIRSRKGKGKR